VSRPCNRSQITPWLGQFQSRAGFSECLDLSGVYATVDDYDGFNPVLGFLSVSTVRRRHRSRRVRMFQSRAGFSECLDFVSFAPTSSPSWFQSRAGFSECLDFFWLVTTHPVAAFQSRAGFSECLDRKFSITATSTQMFQSRAGFSECLDPIPSSQPATKCSFNPVLGFLSVSTGQLGDRWDGHRGVSIPCWVF